MKTINTERYCRYKDGAAYFHVCLSTFQKWVKAADAVYCKEGNCVIIDLEKVKEYLKER